MEKPYHNRQSLWAMGKENDKMNIILCHLVPARVNYIFGILDLGLRTKPDLHPILSLGFKYNTNFSLCTTILVKNNELRMNAH